jgi:hypothetical protein
MFTLIYDAFNAHTKAEWSLYNHGDLLSQATNFTAVWKWVINPFTQTDGAVEARIEVLQHLARTVKDAGDEENVQAYANRQMERSNNANAETFAYNSRLIVCDRSDDIDWAKST